MLWYVVVLWLTFTIRRFVRLIFVLPFIMQSSLDTIVAGVEINSQKQQEYTIISVGDVNRRKAVKESNLMAILMNVVDGRLLTPYRQQN